MKDTVIEKIDSDKLENIKATEEFYIQSSAEEDISCYARIITRETTWMNLDGCERLLYLKRKQDYANQLLRDKKLIHLNEVHEILGIPKTRAGDYVGWKYYPDNLVGDNYVDFDIYSERNVDFVNGYGDIVILDFNVDGCIGKRKNI